MIDVSRISDLYWRSIGVANFCVNNRGSALPNLWALWGNTISPSVIFVSSQCIILELSIDNNNVYVAAVYASTNYLTRRDLWADLTLEIGRHTGPWLFLGNFNAILGAHEKRGRRPPPPLSCMDFLHWSNANLLSHLPSFDSFFTWSNGRLGLENVALRLDRAICNIDWLNLWQRTTCTSLVRHHSDHHPILLSVDKANNGQAVPFKF
ncbi:endonuclease/exonuclease/phosphatase family protein [Medicago truncatula]|uniref:Endonuclease/exonuclease/phosphatase family protein n=1 Tax=Medicago truncatula TaxID=3880 RepID=A0A072TJM4_MEDTR|nr:endonuclease/exonuclease/phosphatase family protein [Medicago truncatula]